METITPDNALSFDVVSDQYTEVRPGYPPEMYDLVSPYKNFTCDSHILEIGAGHGIATREIYDKWQPYITIIEPGSNFCNMLRTAFHSNPKITILLRPGF